MTYLSCDFVPRNGQNSTQARNLGNALAAFAARCWPFNTAKQAETAWDLDPATAKNVVKGVAGASVIVKALQAEREASDSHWEMWLAMGEHIFGESLDDWEARKLKQIMESAQKAKSLCEERRQRRHDLSSRAASASTIIKRRAVAAAHQAHL